MQVPMQGKVLSDERQTRSRSAREIRYLRYPQPELHRLPWCRQNRLPRNSSSLLPQNFGPPSSPVISKPKTAHASPR
jgi:hypothetical protein